MATKKLSQENRKEEYPGRHAVTLLMGPWQRQFGETASKVLIAGVLNECVKKEAMRLQGYWITTDRVYLVLWLCKGEIAETLNLFYQYLSNGIINYRHHEEIDTEWQLLPLFKYHRLRYEDLIGLLIGEHIDRPYTDPVLYRLKEQLGRADYCSLIDYSGAVGPVIIDLTVALNN